MADTTVRDALDFVAAEESSVFTDTYAGTTAAAQLYIIRLLVRIVETQERALEVATALSDIKLCTPLPTPTECVNRCVWSPHLPFCLGCGGKVVKDSPSPTD